MMKEYPLDEMEGRLEACRSQQHWPRGSETAEDPITGRRVIINAARARRRQEAKRDVDLIMTEQGDCYFCNYRTLSTLFYVDDSLNIVVPRETTSIDAADSWLKDRDRTDVSVFYDMIEVLKDYNQIEEGWLARTFYNLTPSLSMGAQAPKCVVTAIHPDYHYNNLHSLPIEVIEATFKSWQFLQRWGNRHNLITLPFINGGKRPESGQSIACFHSQTYLVDHLPTLFEQIQKKRESWPGTSKCPICDKMADGDFLKDFEILEGSFFRILAHPAPQRNWSLLILPKDHKWELAQIDAREFASFLQYCARAYNGFFHVEPAYNVVIRSGEAVGHVHAEIVPKTETNVPGGYEETTQEIVIDVPPRLAAREFRRRIP